jgi:hypothetical protein
MYPRIGPQRLLTPFQFINYCPPDGTPEQYELLKTVLNKPHINKTDICTVIFEVFTEVATKAAVFRDVTPYGSCKNRRFRGIYRLHHQGEKIHQARTNLAVTSNPGIADASYC